MGNLMTSFNTGVSGLHSAQISLNTTAHNIANSSTVGYTRQSALVTDFNYVNSLSSSGKLAQVGLGNNVACIRQIRNTFIDAQYRLQFGRQSFYETQKRTMDEIEDLFGEMEGEEFLTSINDMYAALNEIAKTPDDIVTRDQLISTASSLIEKAQVLKKQLDDYQVSMNTEIVTQVSRINEITKELAEWNKKIQRYEARGEDANDYRDSRNLLLDELSKYINFEVTEEIDGTISIYSQGNYLLTSVGNSNLSVAKVNDSTDMLKVIWANSKDDYFLSGDDLSYSTGSSSDVGSLKAIMIARGTKVADYTDIPIRPDKANYTDAAGVFDETAYKKAMLKFDEETAAYNEKIGPSIIMKTQAELELYINKLVTTINDILCPNIEVTDDLGNKYKILDIANAPVGDDADESVGVELFSRKSVDRYTLKTIPVNGHDVQVYVYNEEDPDDPYSMYSIDQLMVNEELMRNSSKLPLNASKDSGYADGYVRTMTDKLVSAWKNAEIALNPNDLTTYNFSDYYTAMVGEMATQGQVWNSILKQQTILTNDIEEKRQMVMGVSSDEELANLVKFQHCYNASSRYITVIDEMLKHIIERL